jgi:hypothetical protein
MIVTKKALPRRTFLRGMGTALALPLLDAMLPPMTALAGVPAAHAKRLGFLYVPMGAHRPMWTPPGAGLSELSPTLTPLANVRDYCTVVEGMELRNAYPGTHSSSNAAFLSAATSKWTESSDYYLGTTVDQVAAKLLGLETRLPSLELSRICCLLWGSAKRLCLRLEQSFWSSPTAATSERPRIVFERLFGDSGTSAERLAEMRTSSLLDWMKRDISRLQLGWPRRRSKVGGIWIPFERWSAIPESRIVHPDSHLPTSTARGRAQYSDHAKLMMDLQVLARAERVTRVRSFNWRETSNRAYGVGIGEGHHPLTHNGNAEMRQNAPASTPSFRCSPAGKLSYARWRRQPAGPFGLVVRKRMSVPSSRPYNLPIIVAGGKIFRRPLYEVPRTRHFT